MKRLSPREIYRLEKERAQRERGLSHAELMAEAQRAFDKLLADAKAARKSGRPKRATSATPEAAPKKAKTAATSKTAATRPAAKRTPKKATATKKTTATKKAPAGSKTSARTAVQGRTASKTTSAAAKKRPAKSARKPGKKR